VASGQSMANAGKRYSAVITQRHDRCLLLGLIVNAKTLVKVQVYILLLLSVNGIDSNKQKYQLSRPIAQVLCVQSNNVLLIILWYHVYFRFIFAKQ